MAEARARRRPDRHRAGFTLIEVLIAITVALLLGSAFVRYFGGVRAGAVRAEETIAALAVARSVLDAAGTTAAVGGAGGYAWRIDAAAMATPAVAAIDPDLGDVGQGGEPPPDAALPVPYRLSVVVTAPRGTKVRLDTVRLGEPRAVSE